MNFAKKLWGSFKSQPDIWFFYGFLLTFPLSIRKILFFYPINGEFNEYAGIYLYLSDIFLILTLFTWGLLILYNKKSFLSIEDVPRGTIILVLLLFFLTTSSFISIFWGDNKSIALFRSLKLTEFCLLFIYLMVIVSRPPAGQAGETFLKQVFQITIFLGLFQAIIGIAQFILQHSIGLFWLKESLISPEIPGVAKIILDGRKFIRAYGLFPHPNIFGGFLLISLIFTFYYKKLFHACLPDRRVEQFNELSVGKHWEIVPRGTIDKFLIFFLIIQIIALILTFSKSAWLALIISSCYIAYNFVPRLPAGQLFHACQPDRRVEQLRKALLPLILLIVFIFLILKPDFNSILIQPIRERGWYLNVSRGTILENPVLGAGAGQFVSKMQKYVHYTLENWQFQPVHNVFLLIWSELGIIGLILFILFILKLFHLPDRQVEQFKKALAGGHGTIFQGIILGFIFISFFDHYLWDIQQGQILFWMTVGLLAGTSKNVTIDK